MRRFGMSSKLFPYQKLQSPKLNTLLFPLSFTACLEAHSTETWQHYCLRPTCSLKKIPGRLGLAVSANPFSIPLYEIPQLSRRVD
jgi:hypothetical protein